MYRSFHETRIEDLLKKEEDLLKKREELIVQAKAKLTNNDERGMFE